MKKLTLILIATIFCTGIFAQKKEQQDTLYKVEFSTAEWQNILGWMDITKQQMAKTDMQSKVMTQLSDSITAFQLRFIEQIRKQLPKQDKK